MAASAPCTRRGAHEEMRAFPAGGMDVEEIVLTFEHGGREWEVAHLGVGDQRQWGEFVVYDDRQRQVADAEVVDDERPLRRARPGAPPGVLVDHAVDALVEAGELGAT